jgi:hypothetical protein
MTSAVSFYAWVALAIITDLSSSIQCAWHYHWMSTLPLAQKASVKPNLKTGNHSQGQNWLWKSNQRLNFSWGNHHQLAKYKSKPQNHQRILIPSPNLLLIECMLKSSKLPSKALKMHISGLFGCIASKMADWKKTYADWKALCLIQSQNSRIAGNITLIPAHQLLYRRSHCRC